MATYKAYSNTTGGYYSFTPILTTNTTAPNYVQQPWYVQPPWYYYIYAVPQQSKSFGELTWELRLPTHNDFDCPGCGKC